MKDFAIMNKPKLVTWFLGAIAMVCLAVSVNATTTVTGKIQTLGTGNVTNGAFIRFWLRGCGGNQPRINGTSLIGPTQGGVFYFDIAADASGNISGTLYSTRDNTGLLAGDIECGGSKTAVWYGMQAFQGGRGGPEVAVHALSGAVLDITSVTPITSNPVVTAPSGDGTYLRLDGGNVMTGGISAPPYIYLAEGTAPTGGAAKDVIYGDSTAHRLKFKNNNGSADTPAAFSDNLSVFAPTTSAQLASVLTDATGSGGGFVRATSPTITGPTITGPTITGPTITGTIAGTPTITTPTLTSPVINGTPTGTGVSTICSAKGSGSGTYTQTTASFVAIDSTNLKCVMTVPTGWKAVITFSGAGAGAACTTCFLEMTDAGTLVGSTINQNGANNSPFSMSVVFNGDGSSHTFEPYFEGDGTHPVDVIERIRDQHGYFDC